MKVVGACVNSSVVEVIALLAIFRTGFAQQRDLSFRTDSAAIVSISQQLLDAVGTGDTTLWKRYLHPDCIYRAEDGLLKRKADLIGEIRPLPKGYEGSIKVMEPVVVNEGNVFALSFIADERLTLYGQTIHTQYAETDTYIKTTSGWLLLATEIFELPADPMTIRVNEDVLKSYEGIYELTKGVEYRITVEGNRLMAQRGGRKPVEFLPETETVFFIQGERGRKIFTYEGGRVVAMIERRSGHDLVWTKAR